MNFDEKYQAILDKNPAYEGIFYTAVKTTGIFCRPTCSARKPKPENVEFFETVKAALVNGYRPCKVCRPIEIPGRTPSYINVLLQDLEADPFLRIRDWDLKQRGLEPSHIRRWFKKNYDMTFHAYQRMLRINLSYNDLANGKSVTGAAFDNGYDSLSGFADSFQKLFGTPPSKAQDRRVVSIARFASPLGPMFACATEKGVCLLEFTDRRMLETEFRDLQKRLTAVILPGANPHLEQVEREIGEYFAGERRRFEVALHTPGTDFQRSVWKILLEIPYGETRSYQEQATCLNNPKAVRAVASANGHNRVAIVIPCHRVIGKDGSLTGYGGGLSRKQWLLDHERRHLQDG